MPSKLVSIYGVRALSPFVLVWMNGRIEPEMGFCGLDFLVSSPEKLDTEMSCGKLIVSQLTHCGLDLGQAGMA